MSRNKNRIKKAAEEKGLELVRALWREEDSINPTKGQWTVTLKRNDSELTLTGCNVGEIVYKIRTGKIAAPKGG